MRKKLFSTKKLKFMLILFVGVFFVVGCGGRPEPNLDVMSYRQKINYNAHKAKEERLKEEQNNLKARRRKIVHLLSIVDMTTKKRDELYKTINQIDKKTNSLHDQIMDAEDETDDIVNQCNMENELNDVNSDQDAGNGGGDGGQG